MTINLVEGETRDWKIACENDNICKVQDRTSGLKDWPWGEIVPSAINYVFRVNIIKEESGVVLPGDSVNTPQRTHTHSQMGRGHGIGQKERQLVKLITVMD